MIFCTLATVMAATRPALAEVTVGRLAHVPIVIAADAPPAEKHAADELRDIVARATGTRPEIVTAGNAKDAGIFLGKASRAKTDDLGDEAFRIVVGGTGSTSRGRVLAGTLYGVYTFLEDELGVRFLTADVTHVPHAERGQGPEGRRARVPAPFLVAIFVLRRELGPARVRRPAPQQRRDRPARAGGKSSWSLISHSVHEYVPVARFGKDHPDYFSLVDGKRRSTMKRRPVRAGGDPAVLHQPRGEAAHHRRGPRQAGAPGPGRRQHRHQPERQPEILPV